MTRLLSNVIKACSVYYDYDGKKLIDAHLKKECEPVIFENAQKVLAVHKAIKPSQSEEFVEGLNAFIVEKLDVEETSILREMSSKLINDSKSEAKSILDQAKQEAEQIKKDAFATAKQKGYAEGYTKGEKETQKKKSEFEEKIKTLEEEYSQQLSRLEPQFVQIVASLIEKVTGILVEGKEEVILHLLHKALLNTDKSSQYNIKVANEDYDYLFSKKNVLLSVLPGNVQLEIIEDSSLNKNQCLIETDFRVIDCSLDVQLSNLITDLKLLGGI